MTFKLTYTSLWKEADDISLTMVLLFLVALFKVLVTSKEANHTTALKRFLLRMLLLELCCEETSKLIKSATFFSVSNSNRLTSLSVGGALAFSSNRTVSVT